MLNADVFKSIFGLYATEVWAKPESEFLEWLNAEYKHIEKKKGEWKTRFNGDEWYGYCSNCKEQWYKEELFMGGETFPNFCPNCGRYNGGDTDDT